MLMGCNASTVLSNKPILVPVDPRLAAECVRPVNLPNRALTQVEIETLWSKDRLNLVNCASRHSTSITYYEDRDKELGG